MGGGVPGTANREHLVSQRLMTQRAGGFVMSNRETLMQDMLQVMMIRTSQRDGGPVWKVALCVWQVLRVRSGIIGSLTVPSSGTTLILLTFSNFPKFLRGFRKT